MITRLQLTNFRRHTDTELAFGNQDQLIAICGVNGAGKTTLLEALLFAFYGETRNGRRGLDTLVTRGHELEGVEVSCEFSVAGSSYRVQRRRVEGVSSALLFCEGQLLCEGPAAVDAEMVNVLGMDAGGFKLAVIAKQKELDGLTSLSRRERQRMLARLLRVDVVARAQAAAHDQYQRASETVAAMGPAPDVDGLTAELARRRERRDQLATSATSSREEVARIDAVVAGLDGVEAAYRAALDAEARAQGAVAEARKELERVAGEIALLGQLDEPAGDARDESEVLEALRAAEAGLAEARAAAEVLRAHAQLVETHRQVVADIDTRRQRLADVDEDAADKASAAASVEQRAAEALAAARDELSAATARRQLAVAALERLEGLDGEGECPTCNQPVSAEHLDNEREEARAHVATVDGEVETARAAVRAAESDHTAAAGGARAAARAATEADAERRSNEAVLVEIAELERRRDSYELRMARDLPEAAETQPLVDRVRELEKELTVSRELAAARRRYREHTTRAEALAAQLSTAEQRAAELEEALSAARPDGDVAGRYRQLCGLRDARGAEVELLAGIDKELAAAEADARAAEVQLRDAASFAERRQQHVERAQVAAYTKAVLHKVHASLSTELRPQLEGTLCEVLTRLSEGRFTSARLDEQYDVTVLDDGAYRPLSELSGGECDLVALALRLSLASVVAERHGSDAMGLLILDEVFGSQDASRREAILAALRELRSLYGQVLVISHVGGIEDAADKVVELRCGEDRRLAEVSVL